MLATINGELVACSPVSDDGRGLKLQVRQQISGQANVRPSVMTGVD